MEEPIYLTPGEDGFKEIEDFLNKRYRKDYTLSIFDGLSQATIEILPCSLSEMLDVIHYVSSVEHNFPRWIGINHLSESYVVGMNFTRGKLRTESVAEWKEEKLNFKKIPKIF